SNVLEGDLCLPKPLPGRTNSGEPHSGLDCAREERIERRVLIDPIINCVGKIEILLLCRFVRPRQLRYLLRNEASDVDELGIGAIPVVKLPTFYRKLGRYLFS